jgi:hypothetical protein
VRKVAPDGAVSTIPGGEAALVQPSGVALGRNGALYVLDGGSRMARVQVIAPGARAETLVVVDSDSRKSGARYRR